jgi:type II secretory pathway component PulF
MNFISKVVTLMVLMANPDMITMTANGIMHAPETVKHQMDSGAFKGLIMAVIALYVIAILVQSVIPGAITTFSNTTAISGYGTWSTSVTSAWSTLPSVVIVVVVVIFIAIVVAVINML